MIGVVSYAIAVAWVLIGSYPREVVLGTAVLGLNLIILSGAFGIILLFEARLWLRDVAIANALGQLVQFVMTIGIAVAGVASILWFSWSTVVNSVVVVLWLVVVTRRTMRLRIHVDGRQWWMWLREAAPLALGAALDTIYFRIDIVMLAALGTYSAVGIYSVGYKFSDLLGAVPLAVVTPALTMMVAAWPNDVPEFRRTFRHSLDHPDGRRARRRASASWSSPRRWSRRSTPIATRTRPTRRAAARGRPGPALLHAARVHDARRGRPQQALPDRDARRRRRQRRAQLRADPRVLVPGSGWATVVTEVVVLAVLDGRRAAHPGHPPVARGAAIGEVRRSRRRSRSSPAGRCSSRIPWPIGGASSPRSVYLGVVHVMRVDGPGGLHALRGVPRDDARRPPELGTASSARALSNRYWWYESRRRRADAVELLVDPAELALTVAVEEVPGGDAA